MTLDVLAQAYYAQVVEKSRLSGSYQLAFMVQKKAVAKERNRTGKAGFHYTPTRTREFEAYIAEVAERAMKLRGVPMFECPVHLKVVFRIARLKRVQRDPILSCLADANLVSANKWDVDNGLKALSDGMNGIVYRDDRQVTGFTVKAVSVGDNELEQFAIIVTRAGLSPTEIEGFRQYVKTRQTK